MRLASIVKNNSVRNGITALAVAVLVVIGLLAPTGEATGIDPEPSESARDFGCNGFIELCDRRLDEVAVAATHNSMSAKRTPGWLLTEQTPAIPGQLAAGVRGLLIDTHYGYSRGTGVCTDQTRRTPKVEPEAIDGNAQVAREQKARFDSQKLAANFLACDKKDGAPSKERDSRVFLCHQYCELGATDFKQTLGQIAAFLESNRSAVMMVIIQDATAPADTEAAFRDSGLLPFVYTDPLTRPLPTLGRLVSTNKRIVVFNERYTDATIPWLHGFADVFQDTPYACETLANCDLRGAKQCELKRGSATNPLFLINHWKSVAYISSPLSQAAKVNDHDYLLARIHDGCKKRRLRPNMIAVNFADKGDVIKVVDELNGFR